MVKSPCKSGSRRSPKTHRCKPIKSTKRKSPKKSSKRRSSKRKSVKKSAKRRSSKRKSSKRRSSKKPKTPKSPARFLTVNTRRKGRNGKMWKVAETTAGNLKWVQCGPAHKCVGPRASGPFNAPKAKKSKSPKAKKLPKGFSPKRRNAITPATEYNDLWSDFSSRS